MPVVAVVGAIGAVASGTAAIAAGSLLMGGLQIAGGVLGAVGAFTGNKKLAKIGAIAGLAGFAGAALTGAGGLFGGEAAAAESATGFGAVDQAAAGGAFGAGPFDAVAPGMPTLGSPAEALSTPVAASAPLVPNSALATPSATSFKPTAIPATAPASSQTGLLGTLDKWTTENPTLAKIISGGVTKLGEGLAADSKLEEEMKRQKELALYKQQLSSSGLINSKPLVSTRY